MKKAIIDTEKGKMEVKFFEKDAPKTVQNFIDLSERQINKTQINQKSLEELKNGWEEEKKNNHSLFTDLLLIKN